MIKQFINYINNGIIFLFVFSIYNDNFLVEHAGENILKIIFLLFIVVNAQEIYENFKKMNLSQDKLFLVFFISLIIVFLIQNLINMPVDLIKSVFTLVAMFFIVQCFKRYPLEKLLYFIWISMFISIIICYFTDPSSIVDFRKSGGTDDMNTFAAGVLVFFFVAIYLYHINKNKSILFISIFGTLYGLFNAGSKTSFVVFGLILLLVVVRYMFFKFHHVLNYKFLLVFLILFVGSLQIDFTEFKSVQNMLGRTKKTYTLEVRFKAWEAGFKMLENNPLIGAGFMQFAEKTPKYIGFRIAPHNTYVRLISEMGIFVFLLFIMFLYVLLIQNFQTYILSEYFWLYLSVISIFLMGLSLGLTYSKLQWLSIALMMNINYLLIMRKKA